jgi:hypothetical protein
VGVAGWVMTDALLMDMVYVGCGVIFGLIVRKLVVTYCKRPWVGLTDEDCEEVERWVEFKEEGSGRIPTLKLIRYIEAKLKGKNT